MKFGVMYDFRNPRGAWWKPYPKLLRELLDQIVAVEGMGYDHVWVTEHHFVEDDYNPSIMTVMAAIAADPDVVVAHAFDRYDLMSNSLRSLDTASTTLRAVTEVIHHPDFMIAPRLRQR
jgi:hypothetical protein